MKKTKRKPKRKENIFAVLGRQEKNEKPSIVVSKFPPNDLFLPADNPFRKGGR